MEPAGLGREAVVVFAELAQVALAVEEEEVLRMGLVELAA